MSTRTVKIASAVGLHARPAMLFVKAVTESGAKVTIAKSGGNPVNAASILAVMGLGIGFDDEVTIESNNDAALDNLAELLATDLDDI